MSQCDISLYGIIDPARTKGRASPQQLASLASAAAKGGITLLQYRDKIGGTRTMIENARALVDALHGTGVPLLINDRVDVALAAKAHGVHVGQDDMLVADARALLGPEAIVGLTIKTTGHAAAAPIDRLDYVCIGGIYSTLSKDNPTNIGLEGWRSIASYFREFAPDLPVGAIAGINETNLADVFANGADGAAIISAIFMHDDVEAAARKMKTIILEANAEQRT